MNLHYTNEITISQSYYYNVIRNELTRHHAAGMSFANYLAFYLFNVHDYAK